MDYDKLICPIEKKADLEIANQAIVAEYLSQFVRDGRSRITESDVLQIHALTPNLCTGFELRSEN
jgi:hypothetical protein